MPIFDNWLSKLQERPKGISLMYKLLPSKLKSKIYKTYMWYKFLYFNFSALVGRSKVSYSDFNEDLIVENIFEGQIGSYIDVGAGHPVIGSNTYKFYEKGWDGITVEPIRLHNTLHRLKRRRDLQIHRLLSESKTKVKLYEFNPTQYSTNSETQYKSMVSAGMKERRTYYLKSISINEVLSMVKSKAYFLAIDCEGYDYEIIRMINWNQINKPRVIVFEIISNLIEAKEIHQLLTAQSYTLTNKTQINNIYTLAK